MSGVAYPYQAETIPLYAVAVYGLIPSVLTFVGGEFLNQLVLATPDLPPQLRSQSNNVRTRKFLVSLYHTLALFFLGLSFTLLLTEIGKKIAGK
jgi:hypothetical protein